MDLIQPITESEVRAPVSRCCGNDASGNYYTILWNPSATRDLKLSWKASSGAVPTRIGCFRLRLEELVRQGYCKREEGRIRFTVYHDPDGWLRVRIHRADGGGVKVARVGG